MLQHRKWIGETFFKISIFKHIQLLETNSKVLIILDEFFQYSKTFLSRHCINLLFVFQTCYLTFLTENPNWSLNVHHSQFNYFDPIEMSENWWAAVCGSNHKILKSVIWLYLMSLEWLWKVKVATKIGVLINDFLGWFLEKIFFK